MLNPHRARVSRREFLNLPGFHADAYVVAYVEDTHEHEIKKSYSTWRNPEPRLILEISDCSNRINLEFEVDNALNRKNSFHKIDTLIEVLQEFRAGLASESPLVKRRASLIKDLQEAEAAQKIRQATPAQLSLLAAHTSEEEG
jgi:hypothetical protein